MGEIPKTLKIKFKIMSNTRIILDRQSDKVLNNATIVAPSGIVKADVGLSEVDNTADIDKPISTATQAAIDVEKGRIDAILLAAGATVDSFKEIVDLINSVDVENDGDLATHVLNNNAEFALIGVTLANLDAKIDTQIKAVQSNLDDHIALNGATLATLEKDLNSSINAESAARAAGDAANTAELVDFLGLTFSDDEGRRISTAEAGAYGSAVFGAYQENMQLAGGKFSQELGDEFGPIGSTGDATAFGALVWHGAGMSDFYMGSGDAFNQARSEFRQNVREAIAQGGTFADAYAGYYNDEANNGDFTSTYAYIQYTLDNMDSTVAAQIAALDNDSDIRIVDFTGLTDGGVIGQSPDAYHGAAISNIWDVYKNELAESHNNSPNAIEHLKEFDALDTPTLLGYIHYIGEGQHEDVVPTHGPDFGNAFNVFKSDVQQAWDQGGTFADAYAEFSERGKTTLFGFLHYEISVEEAARIAADSAISAEIAEFGAMIGVTAGFSVADSSAVGEEAYLSLMSYKEAVELAPTGKVPADLGQYGGTGDSLYSILGMIAYHADGMEMMAGQFTGPEWDAQASLFEKNVAQAFNQGGTYWDAYSGYGYEGRSSKFGYIQYELDRIDTTVTENFKSLSSDLAAEIAATDAEYALTGATLAALDAKIDSEVKILNSDLGTERARIDAILAAAGATVDSFKEIVDLINSVDVENDGDLATHVLNNNAEFALIGATLANLDAKIDSEIKTVTAALNAEIADTNAEFILVGVTLADLQAQIDSNDSDIAALNTSLTSEVALIGATMDDLQAQIDANDAELVLVGVTLADLQSQIDANDSDIASIVSQVNTIMEEAADSIYAVEVAVTGAVDGSNDVFAIDAVREGSERVYLNGLLQHEGDDYTVTAAAGEVSSITFVSAPGASDRLVIFGLKSSVSITDVAL